MATTPVQPPNSSDLSLTQQQQTQIVTDPAEWSDDFARKVCIRDFTAWETYRAYNHDRRFREAERLVTGWVEKKFWEGTKVQRSSIPVFIALQEIEVLQSRIIDQIFSDDPPFSVGQEPGTTLQQAMAVRNLLASQIRSIHKPDSFIGAREIFRRANKSALTYGAGIIEVGWWFEQINRKLYYRHAVAETAQISHDSLRTPDNPEGIGTVPTGKLKMVTESRIDQRLISKPYATNVDIRDFYIDPDTSGPTCQESPGGTATRHLLPIETIKNMAADPNSGFKLPQVPDLDKWLLDLSKKKYATQGDFSKQTQESYRGNQYQPQLDKSVDPALAKIEVIRYWRNNRHVQVLGREWTLRNECNPYGIIPHLNVFYIDLLGRFYGFSIPDLVEGDHKFVMTLLNDRIDELNLILHAPIVRKRGAMTGTSGRRLHPGASWEVSESPRDDVVRMEMGAVNPAAFAEVNASEIRTQKLTGNTDAAAYGVATAGGDSSSRTATGIGAKQSAANARIGYQVSNIEDQTLEPFLYLLLRFNKIYLDPTQVMEIMGPDSQLIQLDPIDVLNADVRFKVQASTKMKTKQALQSGGINTILQNYLNPALVAQWNQAGVTPDMANIDRLVSDALGLNEMTLVRQLSPQEQTLLSQQHQAEMQLKQQLQDSRMQAQQQMVDAKDETGLLKQLIAKIFTPDAIHSLFGHAFGMEHPLETAARTAPKQLPAKAGK